MPSEANAAVLASFLDYLKIEKGLASLTLSAYMRDIRQFAEFLEGHNRTLLQVRRDDVRGFIQQLFSHSVDGRSVARKLSALRHLYRYLLLDRRVDRDPTLNIPSPKQWKVLPKSLGREEVEQVLEAGSGHARSRRSATSKHAQALTSRNRAIFEVFYAGA